MMRRLAVIAITLLVAGCGMFRRTQNELYSIETITPAAVAAAAGLPLAVEAIQLPPAIDRREIVVRQDDHQLEIRGTHLWAGHLEDMVMHTLAFNLANRLADGMVVLPGQAKPSVAVRQIFVVFEELAAGPGEEFVLDARWTLRESTPGMPEIVRHERITIPMQSTDSAAVAAATSQALAMLADRIVQLVAPAVIPSVSEGSGRAGARGTCCVPPPTQIPRSRSG